MKQDEYPNFWAKRKNAKYFDGQFQFQKMD